MNENNSKKRRQRRWTGYLAEAVFFALAIAAIYAFQTRHLISGNETPAPDLQGQLVAGGTYSLSTVRARGTLVYFFAPWCGYCSASMDNINRLRRWREDEALEIVLVAVDWKSKEEIEDYVARHELQVPVVLATADDAEAWRVHAFPTYYVLDKEHRIVSRDLGYSTMLGLWFRT